MALANTAKMIGHGTQLFVSTGTTGSTYYALGGLVNCPGPDASGDNVNTTTLDTTGWGTFQAGGPMDPGEMSLTLAFSSTDAGQAKLPTLAAKRQLCKWKIIYPTTTLDSTVTGFLSSYGRAIEQGAMITRTIGVKVSGSPGF